MKTMLKVEMISTGDEVLYGQIVDTNAAWLSEFFFQEGIAISSRFTVGDELSQLVETLQSRSLQNDVLIVNGGLGPTKDDLSAEAAAKANSESLVLHQEWVAVMEEYFTSRGRTMAPSNIKQAMLPKSAIIVDNPIGTACGFRMNINDCIIFFTPGVPSEFKTMVSNEILPYLRTRYPSLPKPLCYRLTTMGRTESDLATELESLLQLPDAISLGYRSAMPIIELKLTGPIEYQAEMEILWQQLKEAVKANTLYESTIGLPQLVSLLLIEQQLTLTVIEQETSGALAYQLHQVEAPITESKVLKYQAIELTESTVTQQFGLIDQRCIGLALTDFDSDKKRFTLTLATATDYHQYRLHYLSRTYNPSTMREIYSAIALDTLRRYLTKQPLIGANVWLEVIK